MATDIILRSVKASALTHSEMDQNWESLSRTVEVFLANTTIAVTDQNKIIEGDITSGVITLPSVVNASGADTDSFRVTVKNINATPLFVDGNGIDLIEGSSGINLLQFESVEFSLDNLGTGWSIVAFYGQSLVGITATPAEINTLDGYTGNVADFNIVAGGSSAGVTALEFQALDGVTSAIQTQLDARLFSVNNLSDVANAATSRANLGVDAAGTDNSTPVTLDGTPNYITIVGQVITRGLVNLASHVTGLLGLANGGTGSSTAAGARTNLGVDAAGTDNSTNVSLAGTPDYITISGQVITRNQVDLAADVTGGLPYANMAFSNNIVAGDIAPSAVGSSEIATDAVGQDEIAADAVGQAELKTVTQLDVLTTTGTQRVMTGGVFTLWASLQQNTNPGYAGKPVLGNDNSTSIAQNDSNMIRSLGLNVVTTMWYGGNLGGATASTNYRFEYVTASKPYDLGDGEIPLFLFAEIDNATNEIVGVSIAEDPPWAYNGNTNTRPDCYRKQNGVLVPYKKVFDIDICLSDCLENPANMERYLDFMQAPNYKEVEITQAIKNADMPDIPHNLAAAHPEYMKGKSVVLIDPVSKLSETLLAMHQVGDSVGSLFIDKHIIIDNEKLNRCGSECNHIASIKWANHHAR